MEVGKLDYWRTRIAMTMRMKTALRCTWRQAWDKTAFLKRGLA